MLKDLEYISFQDVSGFLKGKPLEEAEHIEQLQDDLLRPNQLKEKNVDN